jgi:hypothetical protein
VQRLRSKLHEVSWNIHTGLTQMSGSLSYESFFLFIYLFLAPCTVHVLPRVNCVEQKFAHESSIGMFLHGKTLGSIIRYHTRHGVQVTCRHGSPLGQPCRATLTFQESESETCAARTRTLLLLKYGNFFKIQWKLSLSSAHERIMRE